MMQELGLAIALEALVRGAKSLACQHVLKFVGLIGTFADRRYHFEKRQIKLYLPSQLDVAEQHRRATYEHLNRAIKCAGRADARAAFTFFFNAFTTLDLPEYRTALVQAMFGNPAPLHRGSRVPEQELWNETKLQGQKKWRLIDPEVLT